MWLTRSEATTCFCPKQVHSCEKFVLENCTQKNVSCLVPRRQIDRLISLIRFIRLIRLLPTVSPPVFPNLMPTCSSENGWMPCTRANLSHGKRSSPSHPPHRQLGRCSAWNILQYTNYVSYCMYYTSHFCMNCRLFEKYMRICFDIDMFRFW